MQTSIVVGGQSGRTEQNSSKIRRTYVHMYLQ